MKRIPSANYSLSIALPGKCSTSHVLAPGHAWERPWSARAAAAASCAPALVTPCGLSFGAPRRLIFSAPKLSPEVWRAPLGPSNPAAPHWLNNSQIRRLDPEKSPENRRRAIHSDAVGPTKRIPSANYSLSIALQENALRVMCLTRGRPGTAPGEPELLQTRPAHQPW